MSHALKTLNIFAFYCLRKSCYQSLYPYSFCRLQSSNMFWNEHLSGGAFEPKKLQNLVEQGRDFAASHGVVMAAKDADNTNMMTHAPFTLLPSPFPEYLFEEAKQVQKDFHILTHKIGQDYEFLKTSLECTIKVDEFTGKVFQIYETVMKEGLSQPLSLGLFRSDYMVDDTHAGLTNGFSCSGRKYEIKQIELNTIAASFAGLGSLMPHLHRYICGLYEEGRQNLSQEKIPENNAIKGLANGIVQAWKLYGVDSAVVMFVVQQGERNRFDQRWLEFYIREQNPSLVVIRKTLREINENGQLCPDNTLVLDGQEVAVSYYRAGYTPNDYPTDLEWQARLLVERSRAIKCPSVAHHLVGTKKVQQILAAPGQLERFLTDEESIKRLRRTFAGLYTLDLNEEGDKSVAMVMQNPARYVLKPQREGGGNNFFGEDIKKELNNMTDPEERTQYILMDRVMPPVIKNYIVRAEEENVQITDIISELGIFGVFIGGIDDEVHLNEDVGHLLRSKSTVHDDGGVAAGRAILDSPFLVPCSS